MGNAVNNMIESHLEGVEFVVANTDAQALMQNAAERQVQMGTALTQGLGAGSQPQIGAAAAEEALPEILDHLAYHIWPLSPQAWAAVQARVLHR